MKVGVREGKKNKKNKKLKKCSSISESIIHTCPIPIENKIPSIWYIHVF